MNYLSNKDKSYCKLAVAIIKSAVLAGDEKFFNTTWGNNLVELASYSTPMCISTLKELARQNKKAL